MKNNVITSQRTFRFSCWISAWVTACFIWSFVAQRDDNFRHVSLKYRREKKM